MATKPPKRKIQPWQAAGFGSQAAYQGSPQYKQAQIQRQTQQASQFRPTQIKMPTMGTPAGGNQNYWQTRPGYRQQSEKYPNAPNTPVEYNKNADTGTVQGAIDAGQLPWTQYLGTLGYKPPPRAPSNIGIAGYHPD